jgi:hypothetical protein
VSDFRVDNVSEEADVLFVVTCLLLTLVILDVYYHTVEANDNRLSPLRITIHYREELTLLYELTTTNID